MLYNRCLQTLVFRNRSFYDTSENVATQEIYTYLTLLTEGLLEWFINALDRQMSINWCGHQNHWCYLLNELFERKLWTNNWYGDMWCVYISLIIKGPIFIWKSYTDPFYVEALNFAFHSFLIHMIKASWSLVSTKSKWVQYSVVR